MVCSIGSSLAVGLLALVPSVSFAWTPIGVHNIITRGGTTTTTIINFVPPHQHHHPRKSSPLASSNTCHVPKNDDEVEEGRYYPNNSSRRSFLSTAAASSIMAALISTIDSQPAVAADNDELIDIYFGCGCFWHVQHEFVQAERNIIQRSDEELTSRAGYAGGKAGSINGKVCYHNAQNIADYGKLGHAEVVALRIPTSKFEDFAKEYCKLFDKDGLRPDQFGDRGPEYRNLVGIPGGKSSPLADILVKASMASGDKLDFAIGKGDDADMPKVSFIMDTAKFPFFVAENYHQFHDGFRLDENYPDSYNMLARKFAEKGENFGSCPNGMMGLGIGGL